MKRYFVTGIGTGVGKTIVSAILTETLKADYWKPVQCGTKDGTDKNEVAKLISNTKSAIHNESYCYETAASPHLAAAVANDKIRLDKMLLPHTDNTLIIEGAGGILVPLNDTNFVIDLAKEFEAEIILVIKNYLGCINHSLLSIDYLIKNGFEVKGLILNGNFDPAVRLAITNFSELPILGEIPEISEISKESVLRLSQKINLSLFDN